MKHRSERARVTTTVDNTSTPPHSLSDDELVLELRRVRLAIANGRISEETTGKLRRPFADREAECATELIQRRAVR